MKDPTALSAAGAAGFVSALGGTVLGIPVEALIGGLGGGLAAVLLVPPRGSARGLRLYVAIAASVTVSVLAAAFLSDVTSQVALAMLAKAQITVTPLAALYGTGFLWGFGAQAGLLMTVIERLRREITERASP